MTLDDYQAIGDSLLFWERAAGCVLFGLFVADLAAFVFEWREHRKWTRTAKAELVGLALLLALGIADWHVSSLQEERERLAKESAAAEAEKLATSMAAMKTNVDSLKLEVANRDEELAPFVKMAHTIYPEADARAGLGKLAADVESLKKQVSEASSRTELDLSKLREPRQVTAGQRAMTLACLNGAPLGVVWLRSKSFEWEVGQYAKQIRGVLHDAGFDDREVTEATLSFNQPGVMMIVTDKAHIPAHAASLQQCLTESGLLTVPGPLLDGKVPAGSVMIGVSTKF